MLGGGVQNKIVNTTFRWAGLGDGQSAMNKTALAVTAVAAAAAAAGVAIWRLADRTTAAFAPFQDLSDRTGVAASQMHALSIAANEAGIDMDAITMAFRRVPSVIADADAGMATAVRSLDAIGVSAQDLAGLSIEDQFYRMADGLNTVDDASTRAAIAQDLFGRSGANLLPLIAQGGDALRGMADEGSRLGTVLSDEAYAAADQFQDAIFRMNSQGQAMIMEALIPMLPQLEAMAQELMVVAAEAIPQLIASLGSLLPALQRVADLIILITDGWSKIATLGRGWDPLSGDFRIAAPTISQFNGIGGISDMLPQMQMLDMTVTALRSQSEAAAVAFSDMEDSVSAMSGGGGGGGGGGSPVEVMLKNAERHNELLDMRNQILEKTQAYEERIAAAQTEADEAAAQAALDAQQAALDAQMERLQTYADYTTQVMGFAWDSAFGNARQGFGEMLKDMAADLAKSAVLGFLRKTIFGGLTGGAGFFL